jgi:Mg2+ and Co2+ transporter CorA
VITGLMGMNFHARIYDAGDRGFWTVIVCILLISSTSLLLARRNRWI